jgi:hypothetical protein
MSTTLFAAFSVFAPAQSLFRRLMARRGAPAVRHLVPQGGHHGACPAPGPHYAPVATHPVGIPGRKSRVHRVPTLRVVRVMDSGHGASHGGRMVISGRMADVCAELDRLAAQEAALHAGV